MALSITNNVVGLESAKVLAHVLRTSKQLHTLRVTDCDMAPQCHLLLLQALSKNYEHYNTRLKAIELDDVKLKSYEGLQNVPADVLREGSNHVADYFLVLSKMPRPPALSRTKIMVVGNESVGKTSLLDCMFPLEVYLTVLSGALGLQKDRYLFRLQGKFLQRFDSGDEFAEEFLLRGLDWQLQTSEDNRARFALYSSTRKVELLADNEQEGALWVERVRRVILNSATHGITIGSVMLNSSFHLLLGDLKLQASIWDFAGQTDYFNNHQYFLTPCSVYLVVWDLSAKDRGQALKGLEFWLRALKIHLPTKSIKFFSQDGQPQPQQDVQLAMGMAEVAEEEMELSSLFSVVIVGTHLDLCHVSETKAERETLVSAVVSKVGLACQLTYLEASCETLDNIPRVQESVARLALVHSYLGETIPQTFRALELAIKKLKRKMYEFPVIELDRLIKYCQDTSSLDFEVEEVQRGLVFLSWLGQCVYFRRPQELSTTVILRPTFLTQDSLSRFFNPSLAPFSREGVIQATDLCTIWPTAGARLPLFLSLMEKLEVSFQAPFGDFAATMPAPSPSVVPRPESLTAIAQEEEPVPRKGTQSGGLPPELSGTVTVVPSLLPLTPPAGSTLFPTLWPPECPGEQEEVSVLRRLQNVPTHICGRLLVRLHMLVVQGLIWRTGALLSPTPDGQSHHYLLLEITQDSEDPATLVLSLKTRMLRGSKGEDLAGRVFQELAACLERYPGAHTVQ